MSRSLGPIVHAGICLIQGPPAVGAHHGGAPYAKPRRIATCPTLDSTCNLSRDSFQRHDLPSTVIGAPWHPEVEQNIRRVEPIMACLGLHGEKSPSSSGR